MNQEIVIRRSPIVFIRRLILIEFLFAFVPILLVFVLGTESYYEAQTIASTVSYPLLLTIGVTALQIVIIATAFASWYADFYQADTRAIVRRRSGLAGAQQLVSMPKVTDVKIKQSNLGQRFGYGTLLISSMDHVEPQLIRDVADPLRYAEAIRQLVIPEVPQLPELQRPLPDLIAAGENQYVEFKSSFTWDYRQQRVNKALNLPVIKNIVAFMNSAGGKLVIGVDDDGKALGLENDVQNLRNKNSDGFENVLNNIFSQMVGPDFRQFMDVAFPILDGKEICVITVRPSPEPVYLKQKDEESFYIRTGNASRALSISQALRYIQTHFNGRQ